MKHIKSTKDGLVERKTGRKIVSPIDINVNINFTPMKKLDSKDIASIMATITSSIAAFHAGETIIKSSDNLRK